MTFQFKEIYPILLRVLPPNTNGNSKTLLDKLQALNQFGGSIIFSIGEYYVQFDKNKRNKEIYFDAVSHNSLGTACGNYKNDFFNLGFEIGDGNYYKMFSSWNDANIVGEVQRIFQDIYKTNYNQEFEITDNIDYPANFDKTIPYPEMQIKKTATQAIVLKSFVIITAIILLINWLFYADAKRKKGELTSEACIISKQFVERQLPLPGGAHLGYCNDSQVTYLGNGRYQVTNFADVSNGAGLTIRKTYVVVIKYNKGQWENINNWALEKIKIQ